MKEERAEMHTQQHELRIHGTSNIVLQRCVVYPLRVGSMILPLPQRIEYTLKSRAYFTYYSGALDTVLKLISHRV